MRYAPKTYYLLKSWKNSQTFQSGRNKQSKILEENQDFWLQDGENEIKLSLKKTPNTNIAKNIIIFIGDGMSLPTVAAARIFKGQQV